MIHIKIINIIAGHRYDIYKDYEYTKQVHKSHLMNKDCTNLFHKGHIPHSSAIQGKLNKHNQISIVHYQKEKFCSSIFK